MTKEDTLKKLAGRPEAERQQRVIRVFEEHYQLAVRTMNPEAALATAYSAAQNYLASLKVSRTAGGTTIGAPAGIATGGSPAQTEGETFAWGRGLGSERADNR